MSSESVLQQDNAQASTSKEEALDRFAAGLYRIASMIVGEGEGAAELVETTVATADLSGPDPRNAARRLLCALAIKQLATRDATSLALPEGLEHVATCIGDDELDAAGVSGEELEQMISGPGRERLRNWLESLSSTTRAIFVLRAVAGVSAEETASLLRAHGGELAAGWNTEAVREIFRQGLCSLASQVLHEANS